MAARTIVVWRGNVAAFVDDNLLDFRTSRGKHLGKNLAAAAGTSEQEALTLGLWRE